MTGRDFQQFDRGSPGVFRANNRLELKETSCAVYAIPVSDRIERIEELLVSNQFGTGDIPVGSKVQRIEDPYERRIDNRKRRFEREDQ